MLSQVPVDYRPVFAASTPVSVARELVTFPRETAVAVIVIYAVEDRQLLQRRSSSCALLLNVTVCYCGDDTAVSGEITITTGRPPPNRESTDEFSSPRVPSSPALRPAEERFAPRSRDDRRPTPLWGCCPVDTALGPSVMSTTPAYARSSPSPSSPPPLPLPLIASFAAALPVHRARPPHSTLAAFARVDFLVRFAKDYCVLLFGLKFVNLKTCMSCSSIYLLGKANLNSTIHFW